MAESLQRDLRFVPTLEVRSINSVNAPGDGIPQNQWQLPVDTRLLILYCSRISHFGWPQQIRTVDLPLLTISCFFYSHTVEIMHFPKKDELSRIDNPNSTFHRSQISSYHQCWESFICPPAKAYSPTFPCLLWALEGWLKWTTAVGSQALLLSL